jgi:hypothetical protein
MDAFFNSVHYEARCELVGRLIADFGNRLNTEMPPAIRLSGSKLRLMGPMVTRALKRMEFRSLLSAELLEALCVITKDDADLAGFHHIFTGLKLLSSTPDQA